jgi:4,5-dihydroxyphthalate decarboxylase
MPIPILHETIIIVKHRCGNFACFNQGKTVMILTMACADSNRTRRLLDATIGMDGYQLRPATMPVEEIFRRAFDAAEFDISELSASTFLFYAGRGDCAYVGIPVFPSRAFRHSAIYVRADGDVVEPRDLRGRIVGVRNYLNTAGLVVRGLLADSYGVASTDITWRVGDIDRVERKTISIPQLARPTDIRPALGTPLADMLMAGEIDALVHYDPPRGFGGDRPQIRRLFPDPAEAERRYFKATGIFPIMHLVGVRRSLLEHDPSLARKVYDAFSRAKDAKMPEAAASWPYGVARNASALESLARYAFEQGLTDRLLQFDELFASDLLAT